MQGSALEDWTRESSPRVVSKHPLYLPLLPPTPTHLASQTTPAQHLRVRCSLPVKTLPDLDRNHHRISYCSVCDVVSHVGSPCSFASVALSAHRRTWPHGEPKV